MASNCAAVSGIYERDGEKEKAELYRWQAYAYGNAADLLKNKDYAEKVAKIYKI